MECTDSAQVGSPIASTCVAFFYSVRVMITNGLCIVTEIQEFCCVFAKCDVNVQSWFESYPRFYSFDNKINGIGILESYGKTSTQIAYIVVCVARIR